MPQPTIAGLPSSQGPVIADPKPPPLDMWKGLPRDLYGYTFSYLSIEDLLKCRLVCKLWQSIAQQIPRRLNMPSLADRFTLASVRHALAAAPQKEQAIEPHFEPVESFTPDAYRQQKTQFWTVKKKDEQGLKLHLISIDTKETRGIIDISHQAPSSIPEERFLLDRLTPQDLTEKYFDTYAYRQDELITLFKDGTVFYWKMTEGRFVRTKVLRLSDIDELMIFDVDQWNHFLLVYNNHSRKGAPDVRLHVFDLSNHCEKPSIPPLNASISCGGSNLCHKSGATRLVIMTGGLETSDYSFGSPAGFYLITLDPKGALQIKTFDLGPLLKSKISGLSWKNQPPFNPKNLTFTRHGFILNLCDQFLYSLNCTQNEEWLINLDSYDFSWRFLDAHALHEDQYLLLRIFSETPIREGCRDFRLGNERYCAKTMFIHLPSGEQLPIGPIDELVGPLSRCETQPLPIPFDSYYLLQDFRFLPQKTTADIPERKSMQVEVASPSKALQLEFNLDIPRIPKNKPSQSYSIGLLWRYITFPFRWLFVKLWAIWNTR